MYNKPIFVSKRVLMYDVIQLEAKESGTEIFVNFLDKNDFIPSSIKKKEMQNEKTISFKNHYT